MHAAAPAIRGVDMEVPLLTAYLSLPEAEQDVIPLPQVTRSGFTTHSLVGPIPEMESCPDRRSLDPTVITFRLHPGAREFDTLKFKKAPQSLETGLFFCQLFLLFYIVIFSDM